MNLLFDSSWRAAAYCLRPRVMLLSLLPLVLITVLTVSLGYFFWDMALDQVRVVLDSSAFVNNGWKWLDAMGLSSIKAMLAPLVVIFAVTPVIVVLSLLVVALLMMPLLVQLVAQRRFPDLVMRRGASLWRSVVLVIGINRCSVAGDGADDSVVVCATPDPGTPSSYLGLVDLPGDGV